MKTLGIIPARGGSKGIPGKNLVDVGGRPLIEWTIEAARNSSLSKVVVSTDDYEIKDVAEKMGLDIEVILRPARLATDDSPVSLTAEHVRKTLAKREWSAGITILLQPTSPFRTSQDIGDALAIMEETGCESVISFVRDDDGHPGRLAEKDNVGRILPMSMDNQWKRRQDLEPIYRRNGAIYATREIREYGFVSGDCRMMVMPKSRSLNIDDEDDLQLARIIMEARQSTT